MTDKELPALFNAADTASKKSQTNYLRAVAADLLLMVAGAIVTSISFEAEWAVTSTTVIGITLLFLSMAATAFVCFQKYEQHWYANRAVAESVKTLSWRYAMKAEPFNVQDIDADRSFVESLKAILDDRAYLGADLAGLQSTGPQITNRMRELRNMSVAERLERYKGDRIDDQRKWYAGKAERNKNARMKWFIGVAVAQLAGTGFAVAALRCPGLLNVCAVFVAVASSALAWLQLKQHQELAQSYGIAAHELGLILEGKIVATDDDLSIFVSDAENAISREHTLWVARRDRT